jgi:hypothetical protein
MDVRAVAVKANIDKAITAIKEEANNGAFSVDFDKFNPAIPLPDFTPVTLKEEMHEEIQAAFTFTLKFDGNTVSWD